MKKHKHYKEIVAWAEGKQIQVYYNNKWRHIQGTPSWSLENKYRVKPELEYVPFNFSDAEKLIGKAIKLKGAYTVKLITLVGVNFLYLGGDMISYTFNNLYNNYTFLDGSPCGKLKE